MSRSKEPYSIVGYDVQGEFPDGCVAALVKNTKKAAKRK